MARNRSPSDDPPLTPELLLRAYMAGIFPMSESRDDTEVFWVDPQRRGVLPLEGFHISRSLRRRILSGTYRVSLDQEFGGVLSACADRAETWINPTLEKLYRDLHRAGHAHSIEVWDQADELCGGVYGVAIGGAFFGESMFSHRTDASKVALAYLTHHLASVGFTLFDTQFLTPHLKSLGAEEISRGAYHARLRKALGIQARFPPIDKIATPQEVTQRNSHTS